MSELLYTGGGPIQL